MQVRVGDEVDFPSYLVTVEDMDVTGNCAQDVPAIETKACNVPIYNSYLGSRGTNEEHDSRAFKSSATSAPIRNHFIGLKRPKSSITCPSTSSNTSDSLISAYNDNCSACDSFVELRQAEVERARNSAPSQSIQDCTKESILSTYPRSIQPKRSALDILSIIGESTSLSDVNDPRFSLANIKEPYPSAHNRNRSCVLTSNQSDVKHYCPDSDLSIQKHVSGADHNDFISAQSVPDWAPVAHVSKKQRLGMKGISISSSSAACSDLNVFTDPAAYESTAPFKHLMQSETTKQPLQKMIIHRNHDALNFPCANECQETLTSRNVTVPATFSSWNEYSRTFTAAIYEEINLRLRETAAIFYRVCQVFFFK